MPFDNFFIDTQISSKDWMGEELLKSTGSLDCPIKGIHICLSPQTKIPTFSFFLPKLWISGNEPYNSIHQERIFFKEKSKLISI